VPSDSDTPLDGPAGSRRIAGIIKLLEFMSQLKWPLRIFRRRPTEGPEPPVLGQLTAPPPGAEVARRRGASGRFEWSRRRRRRCHRGAATVVSPPRAARPGPSLRSWGNRVLGIRIPLGRHPGTGRVCTLAPGARLKAATLRLGFDSESKEWALTAPRSSWHTDTATCHALKT
jgi:hypothetical protein